MRPLTQQIISHVASTGGGMDSDFWFGPGVENTRVLPVQEIRIKRQAISAEPLGLGHQDMHIVKIPKGQQ